MGIQTTAQQEIGDQVRFALAELRPDIAFDVSEQGFLRMQIVSAAFGRIDVVERIFLVLRLLEKNSPEVFEAHNIRIEAYTPAEWRRLPKSEKGYTDPTLQIYKNVA